MKIDFDTRTAVAFMAGLIGLIEQELVRLLLDLQPSAILTTTFGGFVLGSIGVSVYRGTKGDDPPPDPPPPDPAKPKKPKSRG